MSMVRFAGVRKSFGEKRVLDELSLIVERCEVYGLLGPNGCGKSTAINILCNLLDPDAGTVEIDDKPASGEVTRVLGVCPQEIALYRDLYPAENLRFFATLYGISGADARNRIERVGTDVRACPLCTHADLGPFGRLAATGQHRCRLGPRTAVAHPR